MKFSLIVVGIVIQVLGALHIGVISSTKVNMTSNQIVTKIKQELDFLLKMIKNVAKGKCDKTFLEPSGAVYVRWGHTDCPEPYAKNVYSGFAGGSHFSHNGGAAEYVCLPKNPTSSTDKKQYSHFGFMYGAEYQLFKKGGGSYNTHDSDVPCAVCQSMSRQNVLMIPARDICPDGWHREYQGQLKSGNVGDANASEYVCVDNTMKPLHGGHENHDGKLFYPVKAVCGSLRCPPYKQHQLLTCAVCTR